MGRNLAHLYFSCSAGCSPRSPGSSPLRKRRRTHISHLSISCKISADLVLLMFVSGIPLQEVPNAKKRYQKALNWEGYQEYLRRTSILFPIPPVIYAPMPTFLKRTLFLEFPMFVFKPADQDDQERRKSLDARGREESSPRASDAALMQ